jgi:Tol biopolymer transport system component
VSERQETIRRAIERAHQLEDAGQKEQALELLRRLCNAFPRSAEAWETLASLLPGGEEKAAALQRAQRLSSPGSTSTGEIKAAPPSQTATGESRPATKTSTGTVKPTARTATRESSQLKRATATGEVKTATAEQAGTRPAAKAQRKHSTGQIIAMGVLLPLAAILIAVGIVQLIPNAQGSLPMGRDFDPAWSPDGSHIVFTLSTPDNVELAMMNADGSNQFALNLNPGQNDIQPVWSPDGAHLAYYSEEASGWALWVVRLDNMLHPAESPARLWCCNKSDDESVLYYWVPAWSPDGAHIAFTAPGNQGALVGSVEDLWMLTAPDQNTFTPNQVQLSNLTQSGDASEELPSWSPDSKALLYEAVVADDRGENGILSPHLWMMDIHTGQRYRIGTDDNTLVESFPDWSPDGKHIAFTSTVEGRDEVFVSNMGFSPVTDLTLSVPGVKRSPTFSPDETRLAFVSRTGDGDDDIWLMNLDGSGATNLTGGQNDAQAVPALILGAGLLCGVFALIIWLMPGTSQVKT